MCCVVVPLGLSTAARCTYMDASVGVTHVGERETHTAGVFFLMRCACLFSIVSSNMQSSLSLVEFGSPSFVLVDYNRSSPLGI